MIKEVFIGIVLLVTIATGLVSLLAVAGLFFGATDAKIILLFSGPIFLGCLVIVSFIKDGWQRLLTEMFSLWPF